MNINLGVAGPISVHPMPDISSGQIKIFHGGNNMFPGAAVTHTNDIKFRDKTEGRPNISGPAHKAPNFHGHDVDFAPFVEQGMGKDPVKRLDYMEAQQPHTRADMRGHVMLGQAYQGGVSHLGRTHRRDEREHKRLEGAPVNNYHYAYTAPRNQPIQVLRPHENIRHNVGGFMPRGYEHGVNPQGKKVDFEQQVISYAPDQLVNRNVHGANVQARPTQEFIRAGTSEGRYSGPLF